jgi:cbb3-type cytochrome oxidase subunit 1
MPRVTRWFVRTSLVYLIAALGVGLITGVQGVLPLPQEVAALGPVYVHLLVVGWLSQLVFGVVYWMFPRFSREKPRGSDRLAWATYGLLNVGLLLRAAGEPLLAWLPQAGFGWMLALSAILQWLAGLGFVVNSWGRVKEK